ncbi:MAG: hypothetical protein HQK49_14035 [Oligoflexia bacterium]|nr:hypothetical protein [Oligoflexia bacterium]
MLTNYLKITTNKSFAYIIILVLSFIICARYVNFVYTDGGIEHDFGWPTGLAKNISENWKFASYTNTLIGNSSGVGRSVHGGLQIQDDDGNVYYPFNGALGLTYFLPWAATIKIFGTSFFSFRIFPLLIFSIFLISLFYFAYSFGGFLALFILFFWIWFYPHFTLQSSFDLSSPECLALLLLMFSLLFYAKGFSYQINSNQINKYHFIISGIFYSLSFDTKIIFIIYLPVIFCFEILNYIKYRIIDKRRILYFLMPLFIIYILTQIFRFYVLYSNFSYSAFDANNRSFFMHLTAISSPSSLLSSLKFIYDKMLLWAEVGINYPLLLWPIFISLTIFSYKKTTTFFQLLIIACYADILYFVLLNKQAQPRYVWPGLILGLLIISVSISLILKQIKTSVKLFYISIIALISFVFFMMNYEIIVYNFKIPVNTEYQMKTKILRPYFGHVLGFGFPSSMIQNLQDQKSIVEAIKNSVKERDIIYYIPTLLVAEIPPFVNKVFYPLTKERLSYFYLRDSFLILGPYQSDNNPFRLVPIGYSSSIQNQLCSQVIFQNHSYMLCKLKFGLYK